MSRASMPPRRRSQPDLDHGTGRGRILPDGRIPVTWTAAPGTAPVTLLFAAP